MAKQAKESATVKRDVIASAQVRAAVNRLLLSKVGSQFCAGEPDLDVLQELWQVPILLVTPGLTVGQVGAAQVQFHTREIIGHTEIESLYAAADRLRERHHAAIKTAFLQARKG